jgi:hypothetical protein
MTDGAHLGVGAPRALETIVGGKESPSEDEQMSLAQFAEWIRSCPDSVNDYNDTARLAAKYLLAYLEAHPDQQEWPLENQYDWDRMQADDVVPEPAKWDRYQTQQGIWDLAVAQYPILRELGLTGFMAGWAFNAARSIIELPPAPNPAIVNIGGSDG